MCRLSWSALDVTADLFLWDNRAIFYMINKTIYMGCLEIWNVFLVLNRISHLFALLTREISWSTLENKFHISAHPCIILSIISISILTLNNKLFVRLFIVLLGSRCTKHLNWWRITLQNFWFRTLSGSRHSGIFTWRIRYDGK